MGICSTIKSELRARDRKTATIVTTVAGFALALALILGVDHGFMAGLFGIVGVGVAGLAVRFAIGGRSLRLIGIAVLEVVSGLLLVTALV